MKNILIIFVFVICSKSFGQSTNCFDQPRYTKTTDPNDNTLYSYGTTNLNPNGSNGAPMNFNWVTQTSYQIFTQSNLTSYDQTIVSPFHCTGSTPVTGGCSDNNLTIYNNIHQDNFNFSNDLAKLKAMDVLPEDGWELLKYSFGRAKTNVLNDVGVAQTAPYVWLYNRYTGKSKFFIAITSAVGIANVLNSAVVRFSTTPNGQYDIFANAKPFTHILSAFNHSDDINAVAYCDIKPVGNGYSPFQYYWLYSEFTLSYDPCVCRATSQYASIDFEVFTVSNASIQLDLEGTSTSVYNGNGLVSDGKSVIASSINDNALLSNGNQILSTVVGASKAAIQGYNNWKEYADKIKGFFNSQTSNGSTVPVNNPQMMQLITTVATSLGQGSANTSVKTQVTYDYLNGTNGSGSNPSQKPTAEAVQVLAGLAPLVEDLASAVPYIGAFIALTNFFTDAGSNHSQDLPATQPAAPPSVNILSAKITGGAQFSSNVTNGLIYMPGLAPNHNFSTYNNADNNYPIYNNALGVFNIIDVPNFVYKTIPQTNNGVEPNNPNSNYGYYRSLAFNYPTQDPMQPTTNTRNPFDNVYDYKLPSPIKYALNPASNLTVKSIDAAFVIEYDGDDTLNLLHNNRPYYDCGTNPDNWNGYMSGNTIHQKQIPYYRDMFSDYNPFSTVYPMYTGDNLTSITSKLINQGFEVEYKSSGFTSALGTDAPSEKLRLRTKYVPLQTLQSIDFVLLGAQNNKPKIYLKLFCKFSKNNKPNDEPVTLVLTYDISDKLKNAQANGSGGNCIFNYYYFKDKGAPCNANKPADYGHFGGLYVYGAYYNPTYGSVGPLNLNSSGNGALSTNNINISNSTVLLPSNSGSGYFTYAAFNDITIGDDVKIATLSGSSSQNIGVKAGGNITIGKGLYTNAIGTNNNVTYAAGSDITINDSHWIGLFNANILNMYAGHNITLNQNTNIQNIYNNATYANIVNSRLLAGNQIVLNVAPNANEIVITGESVLSTKDYVPNAYAMLYNDDGSTPISSLQADDQALVAICSTPSINNRLMSSADTTKSSASNSAPKKPASFKAINDAKIGIYPNPTTGELNVNFFIMEANDVTLTLENITGELLLQQEIHVEQGYSNNKIDIQGFANGIYLLKIENKPGNLIKTQKIILNR